MVIKRMATIPLKPDAVCIQRILFTRDSGAKIFKKTKTLNDHLKSINCLYYIKAKVNI